MLAAWELETSENTNNYFLEEFRLHFASVVDEESFSKRINAGIHYMIFKYDHYHTLEEAAFASVIWLHYHTLEKAAFSPVFYHSIKIDILFCWNIILTKCWWQYFITSYPWGGSVIVQAIYTKLVYHSNFSHNCVNLLLMNWCVQSSFKLLY